MRERVGEKGPCAWVDTSSSSFGRSGRVSLRGDACVLCFSPEHHGSFPARSLLAAVGGVVAYHRKVSVPSDYCSRCGGTAPHLPPPPRSRRFTARRASIGAPVICSNNRTVSRRPPRKPAEGGRRALAWMATACDGSAPAFDRRSTVARPGSKGPYRFRAKRGIAYRIDIAHFCVCIYIYIYSVLRPSKSIGFFLQGQSFLCRYSWAL